MMNLSPVLSVSELVEVVNNHLDLLGELVVEGELDRVDVKNGRLVFAGIKDSKSSVDLFGLTHQLRNLYQLEPGMKVRVTGSPGLYKGSGRFRVFASMIEPQGEGAIRRAFELLQAQLEEEGLFDPERKRTLPEWPVRIGLITAKGSSAYHDVIKGLNDRMSGLQIRLLPVTVQGSSAVPSLLKAFDHVAQNENDFDLVIMTRGGGSLQDLAAFNDEALVRAVFACRVPVISAIGHEDDVSLTDLVADVRASTPTKAAIMAVKDMNEILRLTLQMIKSQRRMTEHKLLSMDDRVDKITGALRGYVQNEIVKTQNLIGRVIRQGSELADAVEVRQRLIVGMLNSAYKKSEQLLLDRIRDLDFRINLLKSLDHERVLSRGFSITRDESGKVLKGISELKESEMVVTQLSDGVFKSRVSGRA